MPARTASPCTLTRLMCTSADSGDGAPISSTIDEESWLNTYDVDCRVRVAARMRRMGLSR